MARGDSSEAGSRHPSSQRKVQPRSPPRSLEPPRAVQLGATWPEPALITAGYRVITFNRSSLDHWRRTRGSPAEGSFTVGVVPSAANRTCRASGPTCPSHEAPGRDGELHWVVARASSCYYRSQPPGPSPRGDAVRPEPRSSVRLPSFPRLRGPRGILVPFTANLSTLTPALSTVTGQPRVGASRQPDLVSGREPGDFAPSGTEGLVAGGPLSHQRQCQRS